MPPDLHARRHFLILNRESLVSKDKFAHLLGHRDIRIDAVDGLANGCFELRVLLQGCQIKFLALVLRPFCVILADQFAIAGFDGRARPRWRKRQCDTASLRV